MNHSSLEQALLLGSLGLRAACVSAGVAGFVWPRLLASRGGFALARLLLLLAIAATLGVAFRAIRTTWLGNDASMLEGDAILVTGALLGALLASMQPRPAGVAGSLTLGGLLVLGCLIWQAEASVPPELDLAKHTINPPEKWLVPASHSAVTDRQSQIPLYVAACIPPELHEEARRIDALYSDRLIKVAPIDYGHNCHGWTFTGGRYYVLCDHVDQILEENGYKEVATPCEGDLIIYRGKGDRIVHSGIVRVADEQGLVVVESKWGVQGRYLHRAEDQCYTSRFAYYRSPRAGHRLLGIGGGEEKIRSAASANLLLDIGY